ncbi:MAG: DUF1553 domain-containing protein [Planctomycetota bacterium]|nr:DUF1553 domain-containing protein [Planctomycetota bacterium]
MKSPQACVLLTLHVLTFSCLCVPTTPLHAENERAAVAAMQVTPATIQLSSRRSAVQLLVTGTLVNGRQVDLTRDARYQVQDAGLLQVTQGRVTAVANGETQLIINVGDHLTTIPVSIIGTEHADPVSFQYETLAVITKQGCNAGSCHGSPDGKGGFSLSLFAFDPEVDKRALVRAGFNRRTNVYEPNQSLILKKPLLRIPHVGGKRLRTDDVAYRVLYDWIYEGAQDDAEGRASCTGIEIQPGPARVLHAPDLRQQISVTAHFSDGSSRDVTRIATYATSHQEVATVDADGLVEGLQRGHSAITVRYLEHLESVDFTFCEAVDGFQWPVDEQPQNYVDKLVNARLQLLQYPPSPLCNDAVFIRRLYLDLTGLLPPAAAVEGFLSDDAIDKRSRWIERVLDSDEFPRFQALRMADLLRVNPKVLKDGRARLFADWLAQSMKQNMPFDKLVGQMLTATGDSKLVPPTNYFAAIGTVQEVTEATAQLFMGSRIQCAKCHNHPFENWTQNDYYSLGAVFSHLTRDGGVIRPQQTNGMANPRTGQTMRPWGTIRTEKTPHPIAAGNDARQAFSQWLTAATNPFFARVEVNRIWAHLLGRGIVDPVDDFRSSNPPSNGALLDALAADFVSSGYDRKSMFRVICNSRAYQRSTATTPLNQQDNELFSHQRVRLLTAEQLTDAIGLVTGGVAPIAKLSAQVAQARAAVEVRWEKLDTLQTTWEQQHVTRAQEAPFWRGGFWESTPFAAKNGAAAFDTVRPPETGMLKSLAALDDPQNGLTVNTERKHSDSMQFPKGGAAARYVYHPVIANRACRVQMHVTADDGLKAWQNGQQVYAQQQVTDNPDVYLQELSLVKGLNLFLFKAVNKGGAYHFHIKLTHLPEEGEKAGSIPELPGYHLAVMHLPVDQRTPQQTQALQAYYYGQDAELSDLRKTLNAEGLDHYATQRPLPKETMFLKTFGQPQRISPCVCDRSNEPSLDQALQLLNGKHVFDQVQKSLQKYGPLKEPRELVQQLYLTAFSRHPSDAESKSATAFLAASANRDDAIRDLVWAIINTQEFMFQH